MKTLHTENFTEFTVLPYIIGGFGLAALLMVFYSNKKSVIALFASFLLFGLLAGVDFYRWNYNYGHDLDPNAAIQVPGMAYQPPLIGYKQLLNFGAFSMPDTGGWMLIAAGGILFAALAKETRLLKRFGKKTAGPGAALMMAFLLLSCSEPGPTPIRINHDSCEFCKMTISNSHFGAQAVTAKGRHYNFDDVSCMVMYAKANPKVQYHSFYISDYLQDNVLIPAESSFYLRGGSISSPMRGNTAAFSTQKATEQNREKLGATPFTWRQIFETYQ